MFQIGTSLREARLRQGIDFVEAESATKIRPKYLQALEEERFDILPSPTYVKGFLRSYADFLGLDGQLYVDEYNSRYVAGEEEPLARPRRSAAAVREQRRIESHALAVALAGIAAAAALVIVAWRWGGPDDATVPNLPPAGGTATGRRTAPPPARPANAWLTLTLRASRGNSRVTVERIRRDGTRRVIFDGTLERGSTTALAGWRLRFFAASPRALTARIDGHPARIPVDGSRPATLLVTRRGIVPAAS